jgi:ABC-type sugar transport system ATPase subunit
MASELKPRDVPVRPTGAGEELLAAKGISKFFGSMQALKGVDLVLRAGEIHALVGANGAGKSTLSRVLCGHIIPEAGETRIRGRPVRFASPRDGLEAGVAMVTQETTLAPDLPVIENVFLPRMGTRGRLSRPALAREAEAIIADLGIALSFSLFDRVGDLSIAERQIVEVLKALTGDPDVVFFDEPTPSLSPYESERLFGMLSILSRRGKAIVLVTHRMEEIFRISDRISVLQEGRLVGSGIETARMSPTGLINLMVGKELSDVYAHHLSGSARRDGAPVLRVDNLAVAPLVKDVSFAISRGEILGLGGLVGAGRSEVAEAIYGLRPVEKGTIELLGKPFRPHAAIDALKAGIGFVGEDRRRQGIVPDLSVMENLLLSRLSMHRGFRWSADNVGAHAVGIARSLGLSAERLQDPNLLNFSGGMQQKIIIARSLSTDPRLLLLDEPTRGVDIETRSTIYKAVRERANDGLGVLWISSDFEELLGVCDRVIVLSDGRSVADLPCAELDVEKLMMFAAPKSSSNAVSVLLEQLAERFGGAAFWIYIDGARVYCFDSAGTVGGTALLERGTVMSLPDLGFGPALAAGEQHFAVDAGSGHRLATVSLTTRRGHYFGHLGLAIPAAAAHPPRDELVRLVQGAMANL